MVVRAGGCFELHRVAWHQSMLARDGRKLICSFEGLDLESIRIALRSEEVDISNVWPGEVTSFDLWPGTVHDAPGAGRLDIRSANVVVERLFDEPVTLEEMQAIEDAGAGCLEMRDVRFARTYFSSDRKRMLCLYTAPDAESVRQAQREAGMPVESVWAFEILHPERLA